MPWHSSVVRTRGTRALRRALSTGRTDACRGGRGRSTYYGCRGGRGVPAGRRWARELRWRVEGLGSSSGLGLGLG
eukprot:scaffold120453_cov33-Phaeocystis_antarctica.AAC.1